MDWADELALQYNVRWWKNDWPKPNAALAALLREEKARVLAEVRRVVITVRDGWMRGEVGVAVPPPPDDITKTCDQILLRLESL